MLSKVTDIGYVSWSCVNPLPNIVTSVPPSGPPVAVGPGGFPVLAIPLRATVGIRASLASCAFFTLFHSVAMLLLSSSLTRASACFLFICAIGCSGGTAAIPRSPYFLLLSCSRSASFSYPSAVACCLKLRGTANCPLMMAITTLYALNTKLVALSCFFFSCSVIIFMNSSRSCL